MKEQQQSKSTMDIEETAHINRVSGEELIECESIIDTPFVFIRTKETGYITLGNTIVRSNVPNMIEAEKIIQSKDWDLLLNTILTMINHFKNIK